MGRNSLNLKVFSDSISMVKKRHKNSWTLFEYYDEKTMQDVNIINNNNNFIVK